MTDRDKSQIINMWNTRMTIEQIISILPHPRRVSEKMINELRADGSLPKRSFREFMTDKIRQDYEQGCTNVYELAQKYDLKVNTVNLYLRSSGVKFGRPEHNYRNRGIGEKAQQITADLQIGEFTQAEIANKYGVTRQYVTQLKKRMEERKNDI